MEPEIIWQIVWNMWPAIEQFLSQLPYIVAVAFIVVPLTNKIKTLFPEWYSKYMWIVSMIVWFLFFLLVSKALEFELWTYLNILYAIISWLVASWLYDAWFLRKASTDVDAIIDDLINDPDPIWLDADQLWGA